MLTHNRVLHSAGKDQGWSCSWSLVDHHSDQRKKGQPIAPPASPEGPYSSSGCVSPGSTSVTPGSFLPAAPWLVISPHTGGAAPGNSNGLLLLGAASVPESKV